MKKALIIVSCVPLFLQLLYYCSFFAYTKISGVIDVENNFIGMIIAGSVSSTITAILGYVVKGIVFGADSLLLGRLVIKTECVDGYELGKWFFHYLNRMTIKSIKTGVQIGNSSDIYWYNKSPDSPKVQYKNIPVGWCLLYNDEYSFVVHIGYGWPTTTYNGSDNIRRTPPVITIYKPLSLFYKNNINKFVTTISDAYIEFETKLCKEFFRTNDYTKLKWRHHPVKPTSTFILTKEMISVFDGIKRFYRRGYQYHVKNDMTYGRVILTWGLPGTGKSKFIEFIINEFHLDFMYVSSANENLMYTMKNTVFIVEEFDTIITLGMQIQEKGQVNSKNAITNKNMIRDWHKFFDKCCNGNIIYLTSNNYDVLRSYNNGSLVRADRITQKMKFGPLNIDEINRLIGAHLKLNSSEINLRECDFGGKIRLVASDIVNIIKENRDVDLIKEKLVELNAVG